MLHLSRAHAHVSCHLRRTRGQPPDNNQPTILLFALLAQTHQPLGSKQTEHYLTLDRLLGYMRARGAHTHAYSNIDMRLVAGVLQKAGARLIAAHAYLNDRLS
jgi:hypothetical protein